MDNVFGAGSVESELKSSDLCVQFIIDRHFNQLSEYHSVPLEKMRYQYKLSELLDTHLDILQRLAEKGWTNLQYLTFVRDYEKLGSCFSDGYDHILVCDLYGTSYDKFWGNGDRPDSYKCDCAILKQSINRIKKVIIENNAHLTEEQLNRVIWNFFRDSADENGLEQD